MLHHKTALVFALILTAYANAAAQTQEQARSQRLSQKSQAQNTKAPVRKFGFSVQSVEAEQETGRYHLEGVTIDGWRIVLSCPKSPPVEVEREAIRKHAGDELAQKYEEYKDIERFRDLMLHSAIASIDESRTPSKYGAMTIYRLRLPQPDMPEEEQNAASEDPFGDVVAHCWLINELENGEDVFLIKVLSSEFHNWKDGNGYQVYAEAADEALTLGCTEGKHAACQSLPPGSYRAIRSGSVTRLHDKDLNFLGSYRVLSEKPTSRRQP